MTVELLPKIISTLSGPAVGHVVGKAKRSEAVITALKMVGLKPDTLPPDFDGLYAYTLVEYGVDKPTPLLEFFRNQYIRGAFRQSFEQRNPSILKNEAENFLDWSTIGGELRQLEYDPRREFAEFTAVFNTLVDRTRTMHEVKVDHQLADVHEAIQRIVELLTPLDELPQLRVEIERLRQEQLAAVPASSKPEPATGGQVDAAAPTNADDFEFDAYISYVDQDPDAAWVWDILVPRLTQAGLRVAVSGDSHTVGVPNIVNMEQVAINSKRVVLVLSDTYLTDNQATFENILAQTLGMEQGQFRVIPVKMPAVDDGRIPTRLRMLTLIDLSQPRRAEHNLSRLVQALEGPLPRM